MSKISLQTIRSLFTPVTPAAMAVVALVGFVAVGIAFGLGLRSHPAMTYAVTKPATSNTTQTTSDAGVSQEERDFEQFLSPPEQAPKLSDCHFDGTYQVTQDSARPKNGATCPDLESRTMSFNSFSTECTFHPNKNRDIYLDCKDPTNPVSQCSGFITVNVNNKTACEYWVTVKKVP